MDFSKLFPENANNNYVGHKSALWGFILFTCVMTWRSIVHMFFEKYGFHEIANFGLISGDPDPMPLIFRFFSLWGFAQLIFCTVCWVVIFRYRALIPLMYLLWFQHFHGTALDLSIAGLSQEQVKRLLVAAKQVGFTGFGFGASILHVDSGPKRVWDYNNTDFAGMNLTAVKNWAMA